MQELMMKKIHNPDGLGELIDKINKQNADDLKQISKLRQKEKQK